MNLQGVPRAELLSGLLQEAMGPLSSSPLLAVGARRWPAVAAKGASPPGARGASASSKMDAPTASRPWLRARRGLRGSCGDAMAVARAMACGEAGPRPAATGRPQCRLFALRINTDDTRMPWVLSAPSASSAAGSTYARRFAPKPRPPRSASSVSSRFSSGSDSPQRWASSGSRVPKSSRPAKASDSSPTPPTSSPSPT